MKKTRVFISSALDELEYEREIAARVIEDLNLEPSIFEGFPAMSKTLEDAYIDEVKNCEIFILLLWKTLRAPVELEYSEAIHGNKPILIFVKMLKEGEDQDEKLRSFLGSIKKEDNADAGHIRFYKHYRSLKELEEGLRNGIVGEINRRLERTIRITNTRKEMYELGSSIVLSARKRLCITQQTPVLLLGARPYDAPENEKVVYEANFFQAMEKWIDAAIKDDSRECIYLYDAQQTKTEIVKQHLQDRVRESLRFWKEREIKSKHRIRISSASSRHSGPIAVGDNQFAIWVTGEENAVVISYVNEQVADSLYNICSQMGSKITNAESLLKELELE